MLSTAPNVRQQLLLVVPEEDPSTRLTYAYEHTELVAVVNVQQLSTGYRIAASAAKPTMRCELPGPLG